MTYADYDRYLAYQKAYYYANRDNIRRKADEWREENRERSNALRYLLYLRSMKNPQPRHIRKMIEIAARYPKKRLVFFNSKDRM